jgi:hypothetical protein
VQYDEVLNTAMLAEDDDDNHDPLALEASLQEVPQLPQPPGSCTPHIEYPRDYLHEMF